MPGDRDAGDPPDLPAGRLVLVGPARPGTVEDLPRRSRRWSVVLVALTALASGAGGALLVTGAQTVDDVAPGDTAHEVNAPAPSEQAEEPASPASPTLGDLCHPDEL